MIELGESPVNEFEDFLFRINDYVLGFDVSVDNAPGMAEVKSLQQLEKIVANFEIGHFREHASEIDIVYVVKDLVNGWIRWKAFWRLDPWQYRRVQLYLGGLWEFIKFWSRAWFFAFWLVWGPWWRRVYWSGSWCLRRLRSICPCRSSWRLRRCRGCPTRFRSFRNPNTLWVCPCWCWRRTWGEWHWFNSFEL